MTTEGEETLWAENKLSRSENEPMKGDVSPVQLVESAIKEKQRRRGCNKRYREKQKNLNNLTMTSRRKLSATESATKMYESISPSYESLLNAEIQRIINFDVKDRIHESKRNFRWVTPCANKKKKSFNFGLAMDVL